MARQWHEKWPFAAVEEASRRPENGVDRPICASRERTVPQSAAARVATAARRLRCVELAGAGKTYAQIAEEVGYAGKSSARKAVVAALAACEVDAVDDLRRLEVTRLDLLQAASWEDALAGDVRAVDRILRIITLRAKLLGLFETEPAPVKPTGPRLLSESYSAQSDQGTSAGRSCELEASSSPSSS